MKVPKKECGFADGSWFSLRLAESRGRAQAEGLSSPLCITILSAVSKRPLKRAALTRLATGGKRCAGGPRMCREPGTSEAQALAFSFPSGAPIVGRPLASRIGKSLAVPLPRDPHVEPQGPEDVRDLAGEVLAFPSGSQRSLGPPPYRARSG
jgi:hypothetical protein